MAALCEKTASSGGALDRSTYMQSCDVFKDLYTLMAKSEKHWIHAM